MLKWLKEWFRKTDKTNRQGCRRCHGRDDFGVFHGPTVDEIKVDGGILRRCFMCKHEVLVHVDPSPEIPQTCPRCSGGLAKIYRRRFEWMCTNTACGWTGLDSDYGKTWR